MEDWIKGLVSAATKPIRELAESVRQRIAAVYLAFVGVFARVRQSFGRWVERGRAWATAQALHALAVANRLRWLVFTELPRRLGSLANSIQAWTRERVAELGALLRAEARQLRDWLVGLVTEALRGLSQLRDWATKRVAELWADMLRIRDKVTALLTDPKRLALWILAPLIDLLIEYFMSNLDRWADYAWRNRRNAEEQAIILAERVIDRIM